MGGVFMLVWSVGMVCWVLVLVSWCWYVDGGSGGANVTTDDVPPTNPNDGDLWWDSVNGRLNVYYDDVDSSQWVSANGTAKGPAVAPGPPGGGGPPGPPGQQHRLE